MRTSVGFFQLSVCRGRLLIPYRGLGVQGARVRAARCTGRPLPRQGCCASLRDGLRPPLTREPLPSLGQAARTRSAWQGVDHGLLVRAGSGRGRSPRLSTPQSQGVPDWSCSCVGLVRGLPYSRLGDLLGGLVLRRRRRTSAETVKCSSMICFASSGVTGSPADPGRTRRTLLPDCTQHGVVDPEASPSAWQWPRTDASSM